MNVFEKFPEFKHLLNTLLGAQSALKMIMAEVGENKEPSALRIALSEAETISKTAVRLSQGLTSFEAENPGEVNKNLPPAKPDLALDARAKKFLAAIGMVLEPIKNEKIDRLVEELNDGTISEENFQREGGRVTTPRGKHILLTDYFAAMDAFRGLTDAERMDYQRLI